MSRKAKYSNQFKMNMIERILNGESATKLASENNMGKYGDGLLYRWARSYQTNNEVFTHSSKTNNSYSAEFKQKVIEAYLNGEGSYVELAAKYNIRSDSILKSWVLKYNKGIENKTYDPKGAVYTMKSRKTTIEERKEIVDFVIKNEMNYKGTAEKYNVPYANVYAWVKKYNQLGEVGLSDHRGRPSQEKPKVELTDLEKAELRIKQLEKEAQYKDLVIEVLKKRAK
jgi:transposase